MFIYKVPKLEPGPLKKEILHRLRDLNTDEQNIRYSTYPNGIISGCGLFEESMKIGVQPGIMKYSGRLYFLTDKNSVEYKPTDNWTVLKIKFTPQHHHAEYDWFEGHLALDENTNILPNEIEVGRFKLKVGSRLRTVYENFEDMSTEYDTVNLRDVNWSLSDRPTIHPEIMMNFARETYPHTQQSITDNSFCSSILANGGIVSRENIERYIAVKNKQNHKELSNKEIFKNLASYLSILLGKEKIETGQSEGIFVY